MPGYKHVITYTNGYEFEMTSHIEGDSREADQIIWDHLTGDLCINSDVIKKIVTFEVKEGEKTKEE